MSTALDPFKSNRFVDKFTLFRAAFLSGFHTSDLKVCLQMILYDTPGVIEKKMHKLDSMMMNNVRSAAINADCVLVLVDACKMPQKVCFLFFSIFFLGV